MNIKGHAARRIFAHTNLLPFPIPFPLPLSMDKQLGLSLPRILTNQMLDLHEAGDHNDLLNTKTRHLIGQPEYLDSSTILAVTWRDLIGLHSWLQRYKSRIGMTPDPCEGAGPPDYTRAWLYAVIRKHVIRSRQWRKGRFTIRR